MPRDAFGLTIATIGDLLDQGLTLRAHCACGRSVRLDLDMLARRLGRDHSYLTPDLRPLLRCWQCGAIPEMLTNNSPSGYDRLLP